MPYGIQLIMVAVILDVSQHRVHRLSYRLEWLWRPHAIHHRPERLYYLNGEMRTQPGKPGLDSVAASGFSIAHTKLFPAAGRWSLRESGLQAKRLNAPSQVTASANSRSAYRTAKMDSNFVKSEQVCWWPAYIRT